MRSVTLPERSAPAIFPRKIRAARSRTYERDRAFASCAPSASAIAWYSRARFAKPTAASASAFAIAPRDGLDVSIAASSARALRRGVERALHDEEAAIVGEARAAQIRPLVIRRRRRRSLPAPAIRAAHHGRNVRPPDRGMPSP